MPIPRTFAKKQITRLSRIPFFPADESAISDMVDALQCSLSENIAESVVSAFVEESTASSRCPTAGDLRRAVLARAVNRAKMPKCRVCDSTGFVVVFVLVTYRPGTYQLQSCERLSPSFEDAQNFRAKLGKNQDILSAAEPCSCLPADHKILTGERD